MANRNRAYKTESTGDDSDYSSSVNNDDERCPAATGCDDDERDPEMTGRRTSEISVGLSSLKINESTRKEPLNDVENVPSEKRPVFFIGRLTSESNDVTAVNQVAASTATAAAAEDVAVSSDHNNNMRDGNSDGTILRGGRDMTNNESALMKRLSSQCGLDVFQTLQCHNITAMHSNRSFSPTILSPSISFDNNAASGLDKVGAGRPSYVSIDHYATDTFFEFDEAAVAAQAAVRGNRSSCCFQNSRWSMNSNTSNRDDERGTEVEMRKNGQVYYIKTVRSASSFPGDMNDVSLSPIGSSEDLEEWVTSSPSFNMPNGHHDNGQVPIRSSSASTLRRPPSKLLNRQATVDRGRSLRPGGPDADVKRLKRSVAWGVLFSVIRNVGCYLLLAALVTLAAEGPSFDYHFQADANRVIVIIILVVGSVALLAQVVHCGLEMCCGSKRRSHVANMVHRSMTKKQFEQLIVDRQLQPPYVGMQLRLRHTHAPHGPWNRQQQRSLSSPTLPADGSIQRQSQQLPTSFSSDSLAHSATIPGPRRPPRQSVKLLDYSEWTDLSRPVHEIDWQPQTGNGLCCCHGNGSPRGPWRIVVAKDFRFIANSTAGGGDDPIAARVTDFQTSENYNSKTMRFDMLLDVEQGDRAFPDAEPFLVFDDADGKTCATRWYSVACYRLSLVLCLDSLYTIVFYTTTKPIDRYVIVKCINANS